MNMDNTIIVDMNDIDTQELWLSILMLEEFRDEAEEHYEDHKEFPTPWDLYGIGEINKHTERELNYLLGIRFFDITKNKPLLVNWQTGQNHRTDDITNIEFTPNRLYLCNDLMRANMNLYDNDDGDYQASYLYPLFYFLNQFEINKDRLPHTTGTHDTNEWLKQSNAFRDGFEQIPEIS